MSRKYLFSILAVGLVTSITSYADDLIDAMPENEIFTSSSENIVPQQEIKREKVKTINSFNGTHEDFYRLGSSYDKSEATSQDLKLAEKYYEKAIKLGSVDALNALGVLMVSQQKYDKAKQLFVKAAKRGDEIAYFNLGNLAIIDRSLKDGSKEALKMYSKSAEKNYAPAYIALGDIYSTGKGVIADLTKAEQYYQKAADLNSETGIDRLALLYLLQDGLSAEDETVNSKKTFELIKKAADHNNPQALYALSMAYQNGYIVEVDQAKAIEYLTRAADLGWAEAEYSLGYLYLSGYGVPNNNDKAIEYLTHSADHGYSNAQNNLGMLYLKGDIVEKDVEKAKFYLNKAILQGNPLASFNMSSAYALNLIQNDSPLEIKRLISLSAEQGYTPAMNKIVEYYSVGKYGFEQNNELSREWLLKSIDEGDSDAILMLANAYFVGAYGYAKDLKKANEWLEKAKAYDNPKAIKLEQTWRNVGRSQTSLSRQHRLDEMRKANVKN